MDLGRILLLPWSVKNLAEGVHVLSASCFLFKLSSLSTPRVATTLTTSLPLFDAHQPSSSNHSNDASTSDQSKYDQEIGSTTANSRNGDMSIKNPSCFCIPYRFDLTLARRILAEALGSFILIFCISGIMGIMQLTGGEVGLLEFAITAALTVIVVVFSIGPISGAHVNPAVTLASAVAGAFPWSEVPLYVLAQVGGSVLATYVAKSVYGINPELFITRPLRGCSEAFWVELIATFIILFMVASLINETQSVGQLSGFVIGVAIGLGALITGPVSGGSMNPARSLGPAIVSWKFENIWIYLIAPTLGSVIGALSFRALSTQLRPFPLPTATCNRF
ncbi:hypothetical protein LguiB_026184 [Lonicera macranthoides]